MAGSNEAVATKLQLNGKEYCWVSIDPRVRFSFVDPQGELNCGTLAALKELVTQGPHYVRLHVVLEPSPAQWDTLLPLIGYTEGASDTFTPNHAPPAFAAQVDYGGVDVANFTSGKVDVAIARGQQGLHPVALELQIAFTDVNFDSAWSATAITEDAPYEFTSGTLEVYDAARPFNAFVWVHNNHLRLRYNNSVTPDAIQSVMTTINVGVNTPFTADEVILIQRAIDETLRLEGVNVEIVFTHATRSLSFIHPVCLFEGQLPKVLRKDLEVRLYEFFKAYSESGNPEVSIVNDITV